MAPPLADASEGSITIRIAWATDIHLNAPAITPDAVDHFCGEMIAEEPDLIVLAGDTSDAARLEADLTMLADRWQRPIAFVLGNHDFYGGSIRAVRTSIAALSAASPWLRWLPAAGVMPITGDTALIGHDGWADGRLGSGMFSPVELPDFTEIADFAGRSRLARYQLLARLGDQAASHIRAVLPLALASHRRVILVTHVPPFQNACRYEGGPQDPDYLPHYANKALGDVLLAVMAEHPAHHLTVLCGHTHESAHVDILPNLTVITGGATQGVPHRQGVLTI